ncbi:hypothetical protein [Chryseobacterium turcicum]|uniref:YD repeat-containing protein n=1 Tax=Chryseobacterium turcicum TaxID=2898076 RepID=A0A9Q3V7Q8_9FLAO|nr:hypothetical protein [Chryseobacterium turcicum]MCD1118735.1 hypothetical protein [Chryseobacterium turcicum]
MRKNLSIIIVFLYCYIYSQSPSIPQIKTDLPQIITPSPTVAALMKFEEVPVNNYTGTPDISIPLFSVSTHSKDINLEVALKYHPANVKGDNIAGEAGLGWSLLSGGSISRTVRGLPDEIFVHGNTNGTISSKIGLYHDNIMGDDNNYYNNDISVLSQLAYNFPNKANKFYWETIEKGKFDTEHDLWQFNFMGNSGRFYIKKNQSGILEVVPLSDYRVKITNHYSMINNNPYVPIGFTIYDEKGYQYIFDVSETTSTSQAVENRSLYNPNSSMSSNTEFRSSFQLKEIKDPNNNLLIQYDFYDTEFIEVNNSSNFIQNYYPDGYEYYSKYNCFNEIQPSQQVVNSLSRTKVKKIKNIIVTDYSKISVEYATDRNDSNIQLNNKVVRVSKMIFKDFGDKIIKKVNFNYGYSNVLKNRLILKEVVEDFGINTQPLKYIFSYNEIDQNLNGTIALDYWGNFNLVTNNCNSQNLSTLRVPTPQTSNLDLLNKVQYPTGGSSIFVFESNTYSYIGDEPVTDFKENTLNEFFLDSDYKSFNNSSFQFLPVHSKDRRAILKTDILLPEDPNSWNRSIGLFKVINGQYNLVANIFCVEPNNDCCKEIILEKNIQYAVKRLSLNLNYTGTDHLSIDYYTATDDEKKYLFGGGNRISKIGYFSNSSNDLYNNYVSNTVIPEKEKKYNYNWLGDSNKSSGSLSFIKPVFSYSRQTKISTVCTEPPFLSGQALGATIDFITTTTLNNTPLINTHGSDVGYKYVTVFETGKGKVEQEYTSPIDYPEEISIANTRPFIPSKNIDYKRGLLEKETIFDNLLRPLSEKTFSYEFDHYEQLYGYRFYRADGAGFDGSYFNTYDAYEIALQQGNISLPFGGGNTFSTQNLAGYPLEYMQNIALIDAFGWAKLMSTKTENYFYENGSQRILEKNESFEYNTLNKQISQHIAMTEDGSILKTKYFYHSGDSPYSQNRISEIEKIENYKDGKLLDTKKINYSNSWTGNASYFPNQIQSSFGNTALETQLIFDQYDTKGNILQYTTKDGIPTTIIWGYNSTQPIAKIVDYPYALVNGLATDIITASDADALNPSNETALITALNNFRNLLQLKEFQITTYTYDPLIGVTSITPPSGIREVYLYDSANRLKEIRQDNAAGKLLKEFKYNYKQ